MKNRSAFTLIELLVVVLIIGILAAVAVPQYQKVVERAKVAQVLPLLKSVAMAAEAYYLENNVCPTSFDQLNIAIPWSGKEKWGTNMMKDSRSNAEWSLQISAKEGSFCELWMGRLIGPYAGTGFKYAVYSSTNYDHVILCAERISLGLAYGGDNPGDYCIKVLKGKALNLPGVSSYRPYTLP